jgi:EEF1A N-terminal glycine/lysine methyltransferase
MEPEDILSSSLGTLYDYAPIVHSSPGGLFTYTHRPQDSDSPSLEVTLSVPDTETDHWSLHASNIWTSALYVVDHISELDLPAKEEIDAPPLRLIELGAGSGLPSILIAKCYPHISVVASDFPDSKLIHTLRENIARNNANQNCTVVPHAWGTNPSGHSGVLLPTADTVLAADTLWDAAQHAAQLRTLCAVLARTPAARAHLVAGLHTGPYTLDAFFRAAQAAGLVLVRVTEREVIRGEKGGRWREWDVHRWSAGAAGEDEDERERRRWIVWGVLKWGDL